MGKLLITQRVTEHVSYVGEGWHQWLFPFHAGGRRKVKDSTTYNCRELSENFVIYPLPLPLYPQFFVFRYDLHWSCLYSLEISQITSCFSTFNGLPERPHYIEFPSATEWPNPFVQIRVNEGQTQFSTTQLHTLNPVWVHRCERRIHASCTFRTNREPRTSQWRARNRKVGFNSQSWMQREIFGVTPSTFYWCIITFQVVMATDGQLS